MLLIPAENGFNRNNLPWLTFILILVNILAFGFLQANDFKHYKNARNIYLEQSLLEIEKPLFERYVERYRTNIHDDITNRSLSNDEFIDLILLDKRFKSYLSEQRLSEDWENKRSLVNFSIEKTSTFQYSYYPSEPSWFNAFSHMFMHGDIFHLLGNMLFLFLFGYNLELILGRGKMLLTYFISGLVAVGYFAYTTDDKFIPLVGASGAISGLMGGFAGFYGLKKIRYLLWFFVYFNYIKLPALLVLLYWLLKELFQSSNNDGVAYMAHFGGLVAGFVSVWLLKLTILKSHKEDVSFENHPSSDNSFNDQTSMSNPKIGEELETRQRLLQKAKTAVRELNFDLAKDYYYQLITNEPNNASYYKSLYQLEKENPKSNSYKELVINIFQRMNVNSSLEPLADTAIVDIKTYLGNFNIIEADVLFIYCKNCLKRKQPKLIRNIINHLIKNYSDYEELPNLLLHYAFAIEKDGDWDSKHRVLTYLSKNFSSSFAGKEAMLELEKNH